ncbi:MAG TPA: M20/M25/M40 family metallo-hydrolase, partial [Bacteroidota bacterium]|nr:M20/M25/M40 family metallo-hydrolase [Bacteroidota bacterium]
HMLTVIDTVTIPAAQVRKNLTFILNDQLNVRPTTPGITITIDAKHVRDGDVGMDRDESAGTPILTQNRYALKFKHKPTGDVTFALSYSGVINYEVKQQGQEYARGFNETPGIIAEKGIYLAGSTYWVPRFDSALISFDLTASMPMPWTVVSQGTRSASTITAGRRIVRWNSPEPMEEVFLIGARFTEYQRSAGAVDVMAFLRTPDEALANKYLETTAQYLEMYRKLVGPYPFTKFALVENFWETGYGMPSFTLLGEQIIRFPFILHSSYPHELLHNYWGNSAYVDFASGNWCEGLTAYMADHLVAEQRGQADEYRRTTLQKFTDYVTSANDFPLKKFHSRTSASTEAIGYGKSMMLWNMLREMVGDELFVRGFQKFYRDNKYKTASYADIRSAFEAITKKDLGGFFDQWINRTGAPELSIGQVSATGDSTGHRVKFTLRQVQPGDVFTLDVPIAVTYAGKVEVKKVSMTSKEQSYELECVAEPLMVQVDPQFQLFRKLDVNEIPPSLSRILGATDQLVVLPSKAPAERAGYYRDLALIWAGDSSKHVRTIVDSDITELPADKNIWVLGSENLFAPVVQQAVKMYDGELTNESARLGKSTYSLNANSVVIAVRHPRNPAAAVVFVSVDTKDAIAGLSRKLPHYGKYGYLVFEGSEPTNTGKGEWSSANSPLTATITHSAAQPSASLPRRKALATLDPVFSSERMMKTIEYLASEKLAGRGVGTPGIDSAAAYIIERFKKSGLQPGADDSSFVQRWDDVVDQTGRYATVKNIIGIIPGTNPALSGQSVVISAHYDHLGLGWPGASAEGMGKIHYGADDNASGVAVMLELAELLGRSLKPQRTIVFAAFTGEENHLAGSNYYVKQTKRFPASKSIGIVNFDAVGRLGSNKLFVLSGSSAREWKFIFMGASYVTGVETDVVTQDLDASDQRSFIAAGVPGVQLFGGAHSDYHKPTDVASKIDASGLVKVASIGREAILYLADRIEPLTFQGQASAEQKSPTASGERKVSTGSMPDFAFSGVGVRLADVSVGSPAALGGLQKGDVIIRIGQTKVTTLKEYSDALKTYQPGMKAEIGYVREGVEKQTEVQFTAK